MGLEGLGDLDILRLGDGHLGIRRFQIKRLGDWGHWKLTDSGD